MSKIIQIASSIFQRVLIDSKGWCIGTPYHPFSTLWNVQVRFRDVTLDPLPKGGVCLGDPNADLHEVQLEDYWDAYGSDRFTTVSKLAHQLFRGRNQPT